MAEHTRHIDENPDQPEEAKLATDAKGLIAKAKLQSERLGQPVDPITFAQREDDDIKALQLAISKEQKAVRMESVELFPGQQWLSKLKIRFNALRPLYTHKENEWANIEKSLKADPESMRKLQALDSKGHAMNIFGEENGEFIFASSWSNVSKVALEHRNIAYDLEGQRLAERQGSSPTGNAVDIAKLIGVELADPKFNEQLRRNIEVNGWAWLKTDAATRKSGDAFFGDNSGTYRDLADSHLESGSFRAVLRVKKT